jgi:hypothetical protein
MRNHTIICYNTLDEDFVVPTLSYTWGVDGDGGARGDEDLAGLEKGSAISTNSGTT